MVNGDTIRDATLNTERGARNEIRLVGAMTCSACRYC